MDYLKSRLMEDVVREMVHFTILIHVNIGDLLKKINQKKQRVTLQKVNVVSVEETDIIQISVMLPDTLKDTPFKYQS